MPTLNLGILAHVDAGKTTLTERLLYETGATRHLGRVDHGDTTTDSDSIERRRGITIRTAVAAMTLPSPRGPVKVNLIDTPGHSDFVAEVERALAVLDGAVLVVSAVEGVQAQTRVLIRILERLGLPFLVFVNKMDRAGASLERTLDALREELAGTVVAMTEPVSVEDVLDAVAPWDDRLLRAYVDGRPPGAEQALAAMAEQARLGHVASGPVRCGPGRRRDRRRPGRHPGVPPDGRRRRGRAAARDRLQDRPRRRRPPGGLPAPAHGTTHLPGPGDRPSPAAKRRGRAARRAGARGPCLRPRFRDHDRVRRRRRHRDRGRPRRGRHR